MGYSAGRALDYLLLILLTPRLAASVSEQTVYFTMESYTTTVPNDFPHNEGIARVYTRTSPSSNAPFALEITTVDQVMNGETQTGGGETRQLFTIEQQTGWIFLQQPLGSRRNLTGWNFTLHIYAWTERGRHPQAQAVVRAEIASSPPPCACFGEARYVFRMRSDADPGAFGALRSDPQCLSINDASFTYSFVSEQTTDWLYIDNKTSELVLIRPTTGPLQSRNVRVTCTVETAAGDISRTHEESALIAIEFDNNPVPNYVVSVGQNRSEGDHLMWIQTSDPGVMKWQTVSVSLVGKHRDTYAFNPITQASSTPSLAQPRMSVIGEILLLQTFPWGLEDQHILTLNLRDGGFSPVNSSETTDSRVVKVVVKIQIHALKNGTPTVLSLSLNRNASLYSRVAVLRLPPWVAVGVRMVASSTDLIPGPGDGHHQLINTTPDLMPGSGLTRTDNSSLLVFVCDTAPLGNRTLTMYTVFIKRRVAWDGGELQTDWLLRIEIVGERDVNKKIDCDKATCSEHSAQELCVNACGMGSPDGRCKWRQQRTEGTQVTDFSTCSPDFGTCPDGNCDSLEQIHPRLCPLDCIVTVDFPFSMTLNADTKKGIGRAMGPCWCERNGLMCFCTTGSLGGKPSTQPTTVGQLPYSLLTTVNPGPRASRPSGPDECSLCDTLKVVVPGFVIMSALVLFVYIRASRGWPLRRLFSGHNYKPPVVIDGSDSRLNSVLSECSDDGLHLSKGSVTRLKTEFDPKWEFPRHNLVLDKVLGEGEFGCVVRAQALSLRGHTGYTTVAVKMLKGSYSSEDLQDLITEMNLLKDLNHPNVVKLLGASTQKGPLYVIVEYCPHGCLRDFLRRNRQAAANQDDDCSLHEYDKIHYEGSKTKIAWSNRNLLSFAWQICKGMQYLAMLKLVHRDLAARNILVSEGMVIKVSDFGLARDLYESGTYVKTSKSRIPMKWMAPESLFDNIYTTKTDIWSFGVLFWEIVTMGAMPYPGIMSHKLCQLIRQGYRLERPDGCVDEIYNIMQQCWLSDPNDRPDFDVVGAMLERIMEKDADYLDLSCSPYGDCSEDEDSTAAPDDQASSAVPLLQLPVSESSEMLPLSIAHKKEHLDVTDEKHRKEIIVEEETNVDSGPLYGDMDPCRLYSNINNNFIAEHLCKTVSEPNLSSTGMFQD